MDSSQTLSRAASKLEISLPLAWETLLDCRGTWIIRWDSSMHEGHLFLTFHRSDNPCVFDKFSLTHWKRRLADIFVTPPNDSYNWMEIKYVARIWISQRSPTTRLSHRDNDISQLSSFFSFVVLIAIYRFSLHHKCSTSHKYPFPKSWVSSETVLKTSSPKGFLIFLLKYLPDNKIPNLGVRLMWLGQYQFVM